MSRFFLILTLIGIRIYLSVQSSPDEDDGEETSLLGKIIPRGYMKEVLPPRNSSKPVYVEFSVIVQDVNSISAVNMDFRVDIMLHMTWQDSRLNVMNAKDQLTYGYLTLPSYAVDSIWTPNPYIKNAKDADIMSLSKQFASITLFANNSIRYSARVFSVIGCEMEFRQYPLDVQNCSIQFRSFTHDSREVEFLWRPWKPVTTSGSMELLQFTLTRPLPYSSIDVAGDHAHRFDGHSKALIIYFEFRRSVSHHIVQTFLPSILLVSLSWFNFWMGLDAVPGRVTLVVTAWLTLTTLFTGLQNNIPQVSYIKAIDIWMGTCLIFNFAAVGEFIIVKYLKEIHDKSKQQEVAAQSTRFLDRHSVAAGSMIKLIKIHPTNEQKNEHKVAFDEYGLKNSTRPNAANSQIIQSKTSSELLLWDPEIGTRPEASSNRRTVPAGGDPPQNPGSFQRKRASQIPFEWIDHKTGKEKILWEEIDKVSRVFFPLMFLTFMTIFFPLLFKKLF